MSYSVYFQGLLARLFSTLFFVLSGCIVIAALFSSVTGLLAGADFTQASIKMINASVIAIAVFEVARVVQAEYCGNDDHNVIIMLRRTLPRFIGTVCVALSLEGLIMVIKYSQLELAGNLYYPVAIVISASLLLIALGVFLKLAPPQ
ncbi:MAG TPA: hypothetical protein VIN71_06990 [Pseudomonadales bacterium]